MHSMVVASSVTARLNWTLGVGPGLLCLTRRPFSAVRRPPLSARKQARLKSRIASARKELLQLQATCDRIRKDLEAADALALAAAAPVRLRLWNQDWSAVITAARRIAAATKRGVLRFRASTSRALVVLSEAVAVAPDAKRVVQVPLASDVVELEAEVTDNKTALEAPVDPHASIMLSADKIVTRIIHAIAKAGIQPYTITPFHIYCLDHVAKTANFLKVIQRASGTPPFNKIRVVGLDCETASRDGVLGGPPSLIQIAIADNLVAIFHVYRMCCNEDGKFDPTLFPPLLKNLIESETIFKTGVGISGDLEKLQQHYGIKMSPTNFADTSRIAAAITNPGPGASLATLTKRYCGEILTKTRPTGQWDLGPKEMNRLAVLYAAHDARASLKVFKHMFLSKSLKADHGSEKTTTHSAEPTRIYLSHDGQVKALKALQIFHADGARSGSVAKQDEFSVANIRVFLNSEFEGWSAQDPMTRARWSQYCIDQWFKHGVLVSDGDILTLTTGLNADNSTKGTPATKISSADPKIARGGDNIKPAPVFRSDPGPGRSSAPAPASANNVKNPPTKRSTAVPGSTTRGQDKPLYATPSASECLDGGVLNVSTHALHDTAAVPVSISTSPEQQTPDKTHVHSESRGGTPLTPIANVKSKLTKEQNGFYDRVASLVTTESLQSTPPVPNVRIFSHAVGEEEPTDLEPTTESQNSPNSGTAPVAKSKDSFEINTKPSRARVVQKIHEHYVERRWNPDMTLEEMARVTNGSAINALKAHAELSRMSESSSHANLDEISHLFDGRDEDMDNGQLLVRAKKGHWSFALTALFKLRRSHGIDEEFAGFKASLEHTELIKRLTPTQERDGRKISSPPKDTVTATDGEPGTAATFVVAVTPAANKEGSALAESLPDSKQNEVVPAETPDPMLAEVSSTDSPIIAHVETAVMDTSDSAPGTTVDLPETVLDISSQPKDTVAAMDGDASTAASSVVAEIPTANGEGSALAESLPGDDSNGVVAAETPDPMLAEVDSTDCPIIAHIEAALIDKSDSVHGTTVDSPIVEATLIDTSDSAHGTTVDPPIVAHVEAALDTSDSAHETTVDSSIATHVEATRIDASDSGHDTTVELPETVLEMTDTSVANPATSGHDFDDMQSTINVEADPTALSDKLTEDFYVRVNQLAAHSTTDDLAEPREAAPESETDQMTQDIYDAINLYSSALDPPTERAEDELDFADNTADSTASSSTKN
ncbi:hypothetical protein HDU89_003636 [Geranomyces variabilis]|nr:hypothetical protein HDU89_003636 [Geranomyces variabilis]